MEEFIIEYWLECLFGVFSSIMLIWVKTLQNKVKQKQITHEALVTGMKALLYKELKRSCDKYLDMGYIPTEESDDILRENEDIYLAYAGVGGNGTGKLKYEKFKALPVKSPHD